MEPKRRTYIPDLLDICVELMDNLDHMLNGPEDLLVDDRSVLLKVRAELALVYDGEQPTDFLPIAIFLATRLMHRPSLSGEPLPVDVLPVEEDQSWESLLELCLQSEVIAEGDPRTARILRNLENRVLPRSAFEVVNLIALKRVNRRLRAESEAAASKESKSLKA